ncbi:MAG TPA: hypothetical protein VLN48_18410 [Bryobacteraceae bacterium]|nr:hypothetical protein [Bryobacteraceae bacterium]
MSFPDRFELLELLREDDGQTFRAREKATGRMLEVHFLSPGLSQPPPGNVIEQGIHEGKRYVVRMPPAAESVPLESAGAWRIKTAPPPSQPPSAPEPGDFTRMFQLRQAPEPAPLPASLAASKPAQPAPASQPGEFTRAFQRPAAAPLSMPEGAPAPGQPGDFTRMFQTPSPVQTPVAEPVAGHAAPESVPQAPVAESQSVEPGIEVSPTARTPIHFVYILVAIVLLGAMAVFVLVRLY